MLPVIFDKIITTRALSGTRVIIFVENTGARSLSITDMSMKASETFPNLN